MTFDLSEIGAGPALPLRARIIVEGALAGIHRSRMRGASIEFEQHKEYSPGDDLRHLDWKVYARADRYYVKQFEQEAELTAHMVLDASASMAFRGKTISKLDYAAHLVAALSHLLIHQRDRVGFYAFGDSSIECQIPPRARPAHLRVLLGAMETLCKTGASGEEDLEQALSRIGELAGRKRSLIIVASDLFSRGNALDAFRWLRARGHDVVVFHILAPEELELPFDGLTRFRALEGGGELLTNPTAIRREYQRRMADFVTRVDSRLKAGGVEYHRVSTDSALEHTIRQFIERRSRSGTR